MIRSTALCSMPKLCKCVIGLLVLCSQLNINHFSEFLGEDRWLHVRIVHMDLLNNQLTILPINSTIHWSVLNYVDLRDNNEIPCNELRNFISANPDIPIYHDCDKNKSTSTTNGSHLSLVKINGTILKNITSYYKQGENHKKFKDWQNSAIFQLLEAILLAFGFLACAIYKIIDNLQHSLLKTMISSILFHLNYYFI